MTRREEREQAFALLFERQMNQESMEVILESAGLARDYEVSEYTRLVVSGVEANEEQVNALISRHLRGGWTMQRLSKTTIALLQLAAFEMLYCGNIPPKVSINEAVELAKNYGGEGDPKYVNGVLGGIVKELEADG